MNIRIDTNKNGKKVAYQVTNDLRNIRMSLTEAEIMIATCKAASVTYGPNPFTYGVSYLSSENIDGMQVFHTSYTL
jgi:hypothetical protein